MTKWSWSPGQGSAKVRCTIEEFDARILVRAQGTYEEDIDLVGVVRETEGKCEERSRKTSLTACCLNLCTTGDAARTSTTNLGNVGRQPRLRSDAADVASAALTRALGQDPNLLGEALVSAAKAHLPTISQEAFNNARRGHAVASAPPDEQAQLPEPRRCQGESNCENAASPEPRPWSGELRKARARPLGGSAGSAGSADGDLPGARPFSRRTSASVHLPSVEKRTSERLARGHFRNGSSSWPNKARLGAGGGCGARPSFARSRAADCWVVAASSQRIGPPQRAQVSRSAWNT
jgi:hypothetical protein